MSDEPSLARAVDAAQSILATPAATEARSIEQAFARCAAESARAMARLDPGSGAGVVEIAGGQAIFAGAGSPMTQALALGLDGPVTAPVLEAIEAHLSPRGRGALQIELCPYTDPSLPGLLAARGYRVHEWQLAWARPLSEPLVASGIAGGTSVVVRTMRPGEEDLAMRAILAGFLESDDVPDEALAMMRPSAHARGYEIFLACVGDEPIGGGVLSISGDVAFVNGSGVRPSFRRRGAQGALLTARLQRARELGCRVACSVTAPGTASRRNMERHGFRVAYPKVLMLRET